MGNLTQMEFEFNDDNFVSLTAMHAKADKAGKADGKADPREWSRYAGATFIKKLAQKLHVGKAHIYKTSRARADRGGGTWAHWQIGAAYATYLDEELHMQFNATVRALSLGDPKVVDILLRNASEDDKRRMMSKITRRIFTDRLQAAGVDDLAYGQCTNIITRGLLGGKVDEVKAQRGLTVKDSLRDNLSHTELVRMTLAESMAADEIENGLDVMLACKKAAHIVARTAT